MAFWSRPRLIASISAIVFWFSSSNRVKFCGRRLLRKTYGFEFLLSNWKVIMEIGSASEPKMMLGDQELSSWTCWPTGNFTVESENLLLLVTRNCIFRTGNLLGKQKSYSQRRWKGMIKARAGKAYDAHVVEGISKKNLLAVKMKGDTQRGGWRSLWRPRSRGDFKKRDFRKNDAFLLRLDQNWIFCFVRIRGISIGSVYFTGREDFSIVFSIFWPSKTEILTKRFRSLLLLLLLLILLLLCINFYASQKRILILRVKHPASTFALFLTHFNYCTHSPDNASLAWVYLFVMSSLLPTVHTP